MSKHIWKYHNNIFIFFEVLTFVFLKAYVHLVFLFYSRSSTRRTGCPTTLVITFKSCADRNASVQGDRHTSKSLNLIPNSGKIQEWEWRTTDQGWCKWSIHCSVYIYIYIYTHTHTHTHILAVRTLTLRRLMSYIYGAPILDVSRSHTTTQHSR